MLETKMVVGGADVMRLKEWRKRRVMTQQELAEKAGVSKATIVKAEAGAIHPHPSTLRKLAAALGVEAAELLDERDWNPAESQ